MIQDIIGLILRPISYLIPVKKKHWVFGADYGNMYREGSKYLLEYMLKEHPDYNCTFITRNKDVIKELKNQGIPVEHNYSWKGFLKIAEADCVFTTQYITDLYFAYKKRNRHYYYLVHGQPFKIAAKMLKEKKEEIVRHQSVAKKIIYGISRLRVWFMEYWGVGYKMRDVAFVSATSELTASLMRKEFDAFVNVKILGMPRNDALFQSERMKNEYWIKGLEGKKIVTYMPTHRKYGKGKISPIPFLYNEMVQDWLKDNNVVLLVKQHPNMVKNNENDMNSDVIKDISQLGYDPQVVIYHSDVLITDYSSVWMDYLLLRRPLIFYFYDDFEEEDAGCYYNLRDVFPNNYCESEESLFQMMKTAFSKGQRLIPSENIITKYHKYIDENSCHRYYKEIMKEVYGEK